MEIVEIKTKRLIIREYSPSDSKEIALKINNLNVSRYLAGVPFPYKLKDAEWFISNCNKKKVEEPRKDYELAVALRNTNELIGGIGLSHIDYNVGSAELGYWLTEDYWRKGIMSEGLDSLINFAFNKLKLNRLVIPAYVPNVGSNRLAEKLGFKLEGVHREAAKPESSGKIHDVNYWGLLKGEWGK